MDDPSRGDWRGYLRSVKVWREKGQKGKGPATDKTRSIDLSPLRFSLRWNKKSASGGMKSLRGRER